MPAIGQHHTTTVSYTEEEIRAFGPLHVKVRNLVHYTDLSRAEKNVLRALLDHCSKKKWTCWPSAFTIAKYADCSDRTMRRAREGLIAKGIVSYEERSDPAGSAWRNTSHVYTIHADKLACACTAQDASTDSQNANGGTSKMLGGTSKMLGWGTSKMLDEGTIPEETIEDTILNDPTEDASARENQIDIRPSRENETTNLAVGESDLFAPASRSQEASPPPVPTQRGYQRDPSKMTTVTCANAGCSNMWQVFPENAKAAMLCPELHYPLEEKRKKNERAKAQRTKIGAANGVP